MPVEPLTALSVVAGTANKLYDMVNTIKDTPDEIRKLRDEVETMRTFLPGLLDALRKKVDKTSCTIGLTPDQMQRLEDQAKELNRTADECTKKTFKKKDSRAFKKMQRVTMLNPTPWRDLATRYNRFYVFVSALHAFHTVQDSADTCDFTSQQSDALREEQAAFTLELPDNTPPCPRCNRVHHSHVELWILAFLIMFTLTAFSLTILYVAFEAEDELTQQGYRVARTAGSSLGRSLRYKLVTTAERAPPPHFPAPELAQRARLIAEHALD